MAPRPGPPEGSGSREVRFPKRTHTYGDTYLRLSSLGDSPRSVLQAGTSFLSPERQSPTYWIAPNGAIPSSDYRTIGCADGVAASTRSATDWPVRPTSARSRSGLPWVT